MKHTEIALRRPVTTVVVFAALALVGLIASRLLPLEKFPDIEFPGIFIQIPYAGSTPEEIERLITRPVEEALATLSGVETMFSRSSSDQAEIFLQFDWDQSMGAKGIEARAKVDGIREQLPADIRRIFVFTGSLGDQPVLQLRISSDRDLSDSYDLLDRMLKRRLERIEGVSQVQLHGVDAREIRILLRSDSLAAYNVEIETVRQLLISSNFAVSAGRLTAGDQRFNVRPRGEFSSVEEIRNLVINTEGLDCSGIGSRGRRRCCSPRPSTLNHTLRRGCWRTVSSASPRSWRLRALCNLKTAARHAGVPDFTERRCCCRWRGCIRSRIR